MKRFRVNRSVFRRVFTVLPVVLALCGLVLPMPGVCTCECCASCNPDQKKESIPPKSCCSVPQENAHQETKKSCCSEGCRCCESDESGQPQPCNCLQPQEKELTLPEKTFHKTDLLSSFVQTVALETLKDHSETRLSNSKHDRSMPLRLHLMFCVLLN